MTWKAPCLPAEKHCFFGRCGGVSIGRYHSLNVNFKSADAPENIHHNCEIIAACFGLKYTNLMLLCQGISGNCIFTRQASQKKIEADGVVTDSPNIILGISTADCAPVLFMDKEAGIIGAAHAGWKGTLNGIIENTVRLMLSRGAKAENIAAAIGPCIQQSSFEMGAEVPKLFSAQTPENARYFRKAPRPEHYLFDLEGCIVNKLRRLGLKNISASGTDTYTDEKNYFSYRRDTHRNLINSSGDFPTELSTIVL